MYEWTLIGMGFAAGFSIAGVVGFVCCNLKTSAYLREKRENHQLYEMILAVKQAGQVL